MSNKEEEYGERFRARFTELLRLSGLNDQQLADGLFVSKPTVLMWLDGRNLPHRSLAEPMLRWLERQVDARKAAGELEGPEEYRDWFPRMFSEKLRLSGLGDDDVCDEFSIALSTVRRWKGGRSAPHPLMGVIVIQWLDQRIAAREATRE